MSDPKERIKPNVVKAVNEMFKSQEVRNKATTWIMENIDITII